MNLPDFSVAGAPKAGTTALHSALADHPQLLMSAVKEPKYFLCDGERPSPGNGPGDAHSTKEWIWRRERYEALFDGPPELLRGESTPFYLYDRRAQLRIAQAIPRAKFIIIVRDPIDRAHSNWLHLWADGLEPEGDFVAACALEDERRARGWGMFWHYLRLGRYGEQLEHLLSLFPVERVHILRYRHLVENPRSLSTTFARFWVSTRKRYRACRRRTAARSSRARGADACSQAPCVQDPSSARCSRPRCGERRACH